MKDHGQAKSKYAWDEELVETGEKLHAGRASLVEQLLPCGRVDRGSAVSISTIERVVEIKVVGV